MASGALVLVDHLSVPRPAPFQHGAHLLYYDNNNKTSLLSLLDYYRGHKELARRVAVSGYIHAMRHHRAANLIDYVFRTLHLSQLMTHDGHMKELLQLSSAISSSTINHMQIHQYQQLLNQNSYGYSETGYHMRHQAMLRQLEYKSNRAVAS